MTKLEKDKDDRIFGIPKKELDRSYNDFVVGMKKEAKIFKSFENNENDPDTYFAKLTTRKK